MAMTQVVSVRTTIQKQPDRTVGHNHLIALIPASSMLARATTRMILAAVWVRVGAHARLPGNGRLAEPPIVWLLGGRRHFTSARSGGFRFLVCVGRTRVIRRSRDVPILIILIFIFPICA